MPFTNDGVYSIRNVGRNLMLDLTANNTTEGTPIQGYPSDNNTAQKWVIKRQNEPGSPNKTVTIQTVDSGNNGNGFFATASEDSDVPVVYTKQAFIIDLVARDDNTYTMHYTLGSANLVLSIPSSTNNAVKIENYDEGTARQQWELIRLSNLAPIAG
ncbi:uncharacterized protein F5147DRAFT_181649 [Suillus discolor]|uniref:Ricin B lectin domain-containing protein n=1 Tax=Suillus discolor TaxID=1912936 RepID=A0A9P7F7M3_9AGAM|nr:uncharacterized protein F5147DRAFT_104265 [Suillus discolor]XP_041292657.1 uncharacterized protein F5147DRAFT_181649 [Suillus discolor]KAG2085192.1 hypothetical protein F5147DRAFT_104265 [Suillus discolor]KAG2108059.1 hypothetical protein F5147DRAFT_181649 [Suillus discolor]